MCGRYSYEILKCETWNMVSPIGFAHALTLLHRLRPGSLVHLAPVCSSWTWMNRGTSKRSKERPLGDESLAYIQDANRMVSRCIMIAAICICLGHVFILEQPANSLMEHHPKFRWLLDLARRGVLRTASCRTWMGMFGGCTPKPTLLYSNATWLDKLKRTFNRAEAPTLKKNR